MLLYRSVVNPRHALAAARAVLALLALACDEKPLGGLDAAPPKEARTSTRASPKGGLPEATFGEGPIARVNGVEIPRKAFDIYYNRFRISMHKNPILYPTGGAEAVMARVTKRLVAEEVIRQEARAAGITAPEQKMKAGLEEVRDRLKRDPQYAEYHRELGTTEEIWRAEVEADVLREELVTRALKGALEVPESEIKAAYAERAAEFRHPEQVKLGRIRFDIAAGMSGDRIREVRRRAEEVRRAITKGATFEQAARRFSEGSSAEKGGEIGWTARGALSPAIAEILWKTKPGAITDVLEDERGIYIFKVKSFRKEGIAPLDEVRPMIVTELRRKREEAAVARALDDWRSSAKIEILVPELASALTRTTTVMPPIPEREPTPEPPAPPPPGEPPSHP